MQNRENAVKSIGIVTKEYGREIIAEGSKSVLGLEDYLDKLVAKILGMRVILLLYKEPHNKLLLYTK